MEERSPGEAWEVRTEEAVTADRRELPSVRQEGTRAQMQITGAFDGESCMDQWLFPGWKMGRPLWGGVFLSD